MTPPLPELALRARAARCLLAGVVALAVMLAPAASGRSSPANAAVADSPGTAQRARAKPAPATIFVAPAGSDANPCSRVAPCRSLHRAYNAASPGEVVEVAAGRYPGETIRDLSGSKTEPNVVIRAAAGARVSFTSRLTLDNVRFLTLQNLVIEPFADYWPLYLSCARNVVLDNVGGGRRFLVSKGENVVMRGGWWGNYGASGEQDAHVGAGGPNCSPEQPNGPSVNVTLDRVTIRDVFWGVTWDSNQSHPDCLQIGDVDNLVIRNSRFLRCGQVFLGYYGDGNLRGALIENNLFAKIGGDVYYSSQFNDTGKPGRCSDIVFRNNTYDDSGGNTLSGFGFPLFSCRGGAVRVVNNIFHTSPRPGECGANAASWSHNVYERPGGRRYAGRPFICGVKAVLARGGDAKFLNRDRYDYRLRLNSPAVDKGSRLDYPRRDLLGRRRFVGRAPDPGAYERIRLRR